MDKFILLYRDRQLTELLDWLEKLDISGDVAIFVLGQIGQVGGEV